jgi:hypothetical protein
MRWIRSSLYRFVTSEYPLLATGSAHRRVMKCEENNRRMKRMLMEDIAEFRATSVEKILLLADLLKIWVREVEY